MPITSPAALTGKTAVVLMNLGGPDGAASIRPFLYNFFMDKNIIAAPLPVRWLLAQWISHTRSRGAALHSYRYLNFRSPLLANTQAQAQALEAVLRGQTQEGGDVRCFVSMRYWHPLAGETVQAVKAYDPDRVILLPLYPQFSTTTVRSSLQSWKRAARAAGLTAPTQDICCYPFNAGFIQASAALIRAQLQAAPKNTRVLFSAHGLPEKVIEGGDSYEWQCVQTAQAIVAALDMPGLDWQSCYQSRVGPLKWIGPSTEDALARAAHDGVGVVIYPHAFVSEHVETLVEIDIEYREKALAMGIPYFARAAAVGTQPDFIAGLAQEVLARAGGAGCTRICPERFSQCLCRADGTITCAA